MTTKPRKPAAHTGAADTTQAVDDFMRQLDHPFKPVIEALRQVILGADPAIAEGIKWNAPSFRTSVYFATTHLRQRTGIGVVLHLGAKVRDLGTEGLQIADPAGLLQWLAKDRAMVVFQDTQDLERKTAAFVDVIRQWLLRV